jgi:CDP-glucose 4,6-dehydratase
MVKPDIMPASAKKPKPLFGGMYAGKKIFVTGHTGFKGSWLCEWLLQLGAEITGYSLPPKTKPALFNQLGLKSRVKHIIGDVRDLPALRRAVRRARPDFVFHLAAQPLVRESYARPVETFATNLMGTVNLLEVLRAIERPCAAVFVTTDKCYENREWHHGYREEDALGGHDPYSASKATAELAISSYRRAFFQQHPVKIASARAGNVIGGGDWATDRIVPDSIRALQKGRPIGVRDPALAARFGTAGGLSLAGRVPIATLGPNPSAGFRFQLRPESGSQSHGARTRGGNSQTLAWQMGGSV